MQHLTAGIIILPVIHIAARSCRTPWLARNSFSFTTNMKLYIFPILLALLILATEALVPQKQVVITYSNKTPDKVLVEAKNAIKAAVCGA